jgi:hypothetical protein
VAADKGKEGVMGLEGFRRKTTAAGKEVLVCIGGGVGACFFALLLGADEATAMFFGLIVFGATGAVFLWSRFASSGTSPSDIAANIGTALLVFFGALLVFALFFDREGVARCSLYGGLATLVAMSIAVARLKSKYK